MTLSQEVFKKLTEETYELVESFLRSLKKYEMPEGVYEVFREQLPAVICESIVALAHRNREYLCKS